MELQQTQQLPQTDQKHGNDYHYHAHSERSRKIIGKYYLSKTVGKGSMGKVKIAYDTWTNEKIAVKIVSRKLLSNEIHHSKTKEEAAKRAKERAGLISKEIRTIREASIMLLLDHPNIAHVYELMLVENYYYLFMEYIDGGQLLDYIISHGKLKEKQARQFSRQIASALDYCHRNSIVHRDLKVENILLSKTGVIKIIDFGLSNVFSPRSHLSTFCGSLYFAAPELLDGRVYTGPEVDVWSFGVVIYVLVCGQVPFDDPTMGGMHAKVKKGDVNYPSHLSSDCRHLLQRLLVTDPKKRATMSEIIVQPWMVKGYDRPIENHLPKRKPLQLPIDMNVVHGMKGFEFGSEEQIKEELEYLISTEEYQAAAKNVEMLSEHPFTDSSTDSNGHHYTNILKRRSFIYAMNDPQSVPAAYHPLISIYYLVRERMERDKLYTASHPLSTSPAITTTTADNTVSLVEEAHQYLAKKSSHRLTPPIGFSYTADGKTEIRNPTELEEDTMRKSIAGQISPRASSDFGVGHARNTSEASSATMKENVFRRLSRRLSRQTGDLTLTTQSTTPHIQITNEVTTPVVTINGSLVSNNDNVSFSIDTKASSTKSNAKLGRKFNRFLKRATSITVKDLPSRQMSKSAEEHDRPRRKSTFNSETKNDSKVDTASSNSHDGFLAPPLLPLTPHTDQDDSSTHNHTKTSSAYADEYIRPVYLKGLFSVSNTSTKKASAIRYEIIRVLDKKADIKYVENRNKFECIVVKQKCNQPKAGNDFFEYSDDENDNTQKNDDPNSVRFEIYIVKIPWLLGMRGIQFRRVSGDPWQYKNTCRGILDRLLL